MKLRTVLKYCCLNITFDVSSVSFISFPSPEQSHKSVFHKKEMFFMIPEVVGIEVSVRGGESFQHIPQACLGVNDSLLFEHGFYTAIILLK